MGEGRGGEGRGAHAPRVPPLCKGRKVPPSVPPKALLRKGGLALLRWPGQEAANPAKPPIAVPRPVPQPMPLRGPRQRCGRCRSPPCATADEDVPVPVLWLRRCPARLRTGAAFRDTAQKRGAPGGKRQTLPQDPGAQGVGRTTLSPTRNQFSKGNTTGECCTSLRRFVGHVAVAA